MRKKFHCLCLAGFYVLGTSMRIRRITNFQTLRSTNPATMVGLVGCSLATACLVYSGENRLGLGLGRLL